MVRLCTVLGLALLVGLELSPAPVELRWQGACNEPEVVRSRLDGELNGSGEPERWVDVQADVEVASVEPGVEATVVLVTESGETTRVLEAADCDELHQAIALLLAIHVDPLAETPGPEPAPAPAPEPEPEPSAAVPPPEPVPVSPDVRPDPATPPSEEPPQNPAPVVAPDRGFVRAGVGVMAGPLPNAAPMFELSAGWARRYLRLDGRVGYLPPQRDELDGAQVRYQAWDIGGRGCGLLHARALTVPLCVGVGAGAVHGRATGFEGAARDRRALVHASGSVGVDWAIASRLAFWARAEGGATVLRPVFEIEGLGRVRTTPAWRVGALFGVSFDFL